MMKKKKKRRKKRKKKKGLISLSLYSGCSTLLKTLAGEMNGIYLDDESHLNYQGMDESRL